MSQYTTHVLLVEDEAAHAELIRRSLDRQIGQIQLTVVRTLNEALQFLTGTTPDVVVVDLLLPDGKGTELLQLSTNNTAFPVIIMTSHGDELVAVEAIKAGALDYVVKSPVTLAELPRIIERSLREWGHIVARKRAEAEVRNSAAELSAFIESAAQGVLVMNLQGRITLVNRQIERIFGYSRVEMVNQRAEIFLPALHTPISASTTDTYESIAHHKNGTEFPVEISLSTIQTQDKTWVMALLMDISERKRLEMAALEAERMQIELSKEKELRQFKDRFLSMASHELRTPLTVIRSSNDILQQYYDRLSPEERSRQFGKIETQVHQLDNLIESILLISRSEMGRIEFKPHEVDLTVFCAQVVDAVLKATRTHEIILSTDAGYMSKVSLDAYLLEHILVNLLLNAVKYSPEHTQVYFNVGIKDGQIIFQISDNGIGIPEEDMRDIFEPFQRAGNVGAIRGTGMGLAIVREFVIIHGGTIHCESTVGKGTTFSIYIPVALPAYK